MLKSNHPVLMVGVKIQKQCPRGIKLRYRKWLKFKSLERISKGIYLLEESDYQIWSTYFSPLVKNYGEDFAYYLKKVD
jgi:hypothetical protein